jgi:hypothetical protein
MAKFKPTLKEPMSPQSQEFEKDFKKTMVKTAPDIAPKINMNEVNSMLSEVEQSLKKKIFSLSKMESLVFSDPKLSAVYEEMSENGEEKYGYHYNETIMNMLFNDYVLNSPTYLQKYKMAIPKEKKRRDKSGINQLKKAGEKKMTQSGLAKLEPKEMDEEIDDNVTKVVFLVNERDPKDPDLFAYFPEEIHNGEFRTAYSHIGQHSSAHPDYAKESRQASPEEYADLKAELEGIGYNLEVLNGMQESTSASSAGGAAGYVGYAGPAAFSSKGDLSGDFKGKNKKKKVDPKAKPISTGFALSLGETNYLTDPSGFEKYFKTLNEESDANYVLNNSQAYGRVDNMNPQNQKIIKKDIQSGKMDTNANIKGGIALQKEGISPDMYSTKEDLKQLVQSVKQRTGKGLTKDHVPMLAGEALYTIAIQLANKMLPISWDELPDTNSMWDYIDQNGNMSYDRLIEAVKEAVNDRLSEEGMSLEDLGEGISEDNFEQVKKEAQRISKEEGVAQHVNQVSDNVFKVSDWYDTNNTVVSFENGRQLNETNIQEKAKSKSQQRFMGMVHAVQKGDLSPDKVGGDVEKAAASMSDKDAEDFASTKHKGLPEKLDEFLSLHDTVEYVSDRSGENEFEMNGHRWQFVNAKYPDGKIDIGVYRFGHDLVYDYQRWREEMGIDENNIKEDMQTMIQNNGTSMSNKAQATGDMSSEVPQGAQQTGGLNEDFNLLEEINKELEAFSIHHNKLKIMAEDKKTPSMVQGDRLRAENPKNFKKDLQHSGTKEIIDVEKELQWKDQQTDVGDDPQKLGQDIEKKEIKVADMKSNHALKNVGNSTNRPGDEIPKRNLTSDEQAEVDLYRNGQHSLNYDNEPSERFVDRMEADQGEFFEMGEKQKEFKKDAPMYNKDTQPIEDAELEKVQFDKNVKQKGDDVAWNERMGLGSNIKLGESMITGRYIDALGKRRLIEFRLNEVLEVKTIDEGMKLSFDGLGNTYMSKTVDKKVVVNEGVVNTINRDKFYTNGKQVFVVQTPAQTLNESDERKMEMPVVNEQVDKMKHLLGYKPEAYVDTKNVKKNRKF